MCVVLIILICAAGIYCGDFDKIRGLDIMDAIADRSQENLNKPIGAEPPAELLETEYTPTARDLTVKYKMRKLMENEKRDVEKRIKMAMKFQEDFAKIVKYKIGFMLVIVEKSCKSLNDVFNLAVKHRKIWDELELIKAYDLHNERSIKTNKLIRDLIALKKTQV